ncbi:MAG TPA: hypothetical protein VL172_16160 [Kofleriaceae bacterium]|nr:hypothetical protein [Kofleriaceae bacterium]
MRSSLAAALLLAASTPAVAQPDVDGATLQTTLKPQTGFVDDPFAFDGAGGRLLWVNADAADHAEIRVVDLAQGGAQLSAVDISSFTSAPLRADFVLDGNHFFVVARADDDGPSTGALLDGAGKVVRKFGPATEVLLRAGGARAEVVAYTREMKPGKKGPTVLHTIDIFDLASGKRRVHRQLVADETGMVAKLDFRIVAFESDYTRVVGVKGGYWDKKEDQRTPDVEAWYDLDGGAFTRKTDITDVMGQVKKQKLLSDHANQDPFLMVADDLTSLLWVDAGVARKIDLAEPFFHYDHKSLQVQPSAGGSVFFTFTIDPVNADAVARKRAVTEYVDLYELKPGEAKAIRRARLKKTGPGFHFRATGEYWAVQPRHIGFSRGGPELRLYKLR